MTSYNAIPYHSLPVSYTYLPHLAGLGRLFGLETVNPEQCRVLEIGCAEASNIIPMAWHYPQSEFIGIDLSEVQINKGQQLIDSLSLENIHLYVQDIVTLINNHSLDKFDYILLHGVFSWVSIEVQQAILIAAKSSLSDQGLVYISYNTYPGWHAQMVLRDAMILYCSKYKEPEQKKAKIPEAIHYLKGFFQAADNEFSNYNMKRLTALQQHSDSYLFHEFLEAHNHPLYVKDFIKQADQKGFQYLSDALLTFDNALLLGEQRHAFIVDKKDRIEQLQYMDFMLNQRFRRSLLCHHDVSIRNSFAPEHMVELAYRGNLSSKKKIVFDSDKPSRFYLDHNHDMFITLAHPVSKAAVQILMESYPACIHYMDLLQQSCQRVADHHGLDYVKKIEPFYQEFYLLLINDWISLDVEAFNNIEVDWNQPIFISNLSWEYAQKAGFIPSFLLKAIDIDALGMQALKLLHKGILRSDLLKKLIKFYPNKKKFWSLNGIKQNEKQLNIFLDTLNKNHLISNHHYLD